MSKETRMGTSKRKPELTGMILSAAAAFLLLIYAPLELYFANKDEFWFDVYRLMPILLLLFAGAVAAASIVYAVLGRIREGLYVFAVAAGFVLLLGLYIQGTYLIDHLPSLDGSVFDWSSYPEERVKSILIFVLAGVVTAFLVRFLKKERFLKLVRVVSVCLVLVLVITLFPVCVQNNGLEEKALQVTTKKEYEFSDDTNFIILLLDATDARTVTKLLNEDSKYQETFQNFTYYPNMMGTYSSTQMAIPYILSGEWFEHEESYEDYNTRVYKEGALFTKLREAGYSIGVYEAEMPYQGARSYGFVNTLSKEAKILSNWEFMKAELKLVGVKYAPYDLKRFCVFDTSFFGTLQQSDDQYETYNWQNYIFYPELQNATVTHTEEKVFKFIHVEGSHVPFRYDENVGLLSQGATYTDSVKASLTIAKTYIELLKQENVYDNSVIIVMADHGYADEVVSNASLERQNPIFFVKGVGESHDLAVNNAPVSFTDLQEAYSRLLEGKSGDEIFDAKEGDTRRRRYLYFEWLNEDHIEEYYQTGDAGDVTTLTPTGVSYDESETTVSVWEALAAPLSWIMKRCYEFCGNYGLAILLFTLISKLVLLPVSVWVQKNSIKMVELTPEINFLKVKHFGDKDAIAEGQTRLFAEKKYHPLASMIPMVIQLVLLMGVIAVIKDGIADPAIQMNFLGIDLSLVPSEDGGWLILSPIAAALSALLMCIAQNASNVLQAEQSKLNQYGTLILSVGLSLYLGWFVSVGVAIYWIASNLLAIVQLYALNAAINPKKCIDYARLEESKKALAELTGLDGGRKRGFRDPLGKREREDYKRFFGIENKHIVFYSESGGFYKYYKGIIEYLLAYTTLPIHYITGDDKDPIFEMSRQEPRIHAYYIGEKRLITLMMKLEADIVVMTMPDLENYHIKRSYVRKDIEYIYIPHGMDSLNLTMRTHSMDHYDTVFCVGPHQKEEIEKTEALYNSPKKKLVKWGYSLLDEMCREYETSCKKREEAGTAGIAESAETAKTQESAETAGTAKNAAEGKKILIAPSWQPDNIVDSCLEEILDGLAGKGYHVTVRPHPQHVRHKKEKMESLKQRYADSPDIEIQTDFSSNDTVFEADLMITDWSGIAYEYAYTTKKPVLFINTPMKVMNPEYDRIDTVPLNILLRDEIGCSLDLNELDRVAEKAEMLLSGREAYTKKIDDFVEQYVYHRGSSARAGARYIIGQLTKRVEKRRKRSGGDPVMTADGWDTDQEKNRGVKANNSGAKVKRRRAKDAAANLLGLLYLGGCAMLFFGATAEAYIDPSVLTYVIQAVAGAAVAIGAVFGVYWRKIRRMLTERFGLNAKRKREFESDDFAVMEDPLWTQEKEDEEE